MRKLFTLLAVSLFTMAGMAQTVVFTESFDACKGQGGNDQKWKGFTAASGSTLEEATKNWTGTNAYAGSECARAGAPKMKGIIVSPKINLNGEGELTFQAASWDANADKGELVVAISGADWEKDETQFNSDGNLIIKKGAWSNYTIKLTNALGNVVITFTGVGNSRFFIDEVVVTQKETEVPTTENVNITDLGYATFYSNKTLKFPETVTPYFVVEEGGNIKLVQAESQVISANSPVVLKAGQGDYEATITTEEGAALTGNILKGTLEEDVIIAGEGKKIYILNTGANGAGFYWQKDSNEGDGAIVPAGRCYLEISASVANGVQGFSFDSLLTSIQAVEKTNNNADIYDLAGRRVQQTGRGLYIVGGKKVIR